MKKSIVCLVATCVMSCSTVFAEDIINLKCDSENKTISVEVRPDLADESIDNSTIEEMLLYVVSENGTFDDKTADIILFDKIKNENNKFSADIKISQSVESGWYKAVVNDFMQSDFAEVIEQDKRTKRFYVFSNLEITQLKSDFSTANEANLASCIANYGEKLGFASYTVDSSFAKLFCQIRKTDCNDSFNDFAGIYSVYEKAKAINELYISKTTDEAAKAMSELQRLINLELGEDYESYKTDVLNLIITNKEKMFQNSDAVASLSQCIEECIAVAAVNNATRTQMDTVLSKYQTVLGVNLLGDYKRVSSIEVAKALADKGFNTANEIKTAFNNRVSELVRALNKPSSGGGGGDGGGKTFLPAVKEESKDNNTHNNPNPQPSQIDFPDVKADSAAREAILHLAQKGIIQGDDRGNFNPSLMITREEFVALLVRMLGLGEGEDSGFLDVAKDAWYYAEVCAAKKAGIINGIEDDKFGVGLNIIRQDMVTIVYRLKTDWKVENQAEKYYDAELISDYAKEAVETMRSIGAIDETGNNRFLPQERVTREEVAMFLYNVDKIFGGE